MVQLEKPFFFPFVSSERACIFINKPSAQQSVTDDAALSYRKTVGLVPCCSKGVSYGVRSREALLLFQLVTQLNAHPIIWSLWRIEPKTTLASQRDNQEVLISILFTYKFCRRIKNLCWNIICSFFLVASIRINLSFPHAIQHSSGFILNIPKFSCAIIKWILSMIRSRKVFIPQRVFINCSPFFTVFIFRDFKYLTMSQHL